MRAKSFSVRSASDGGFHPSRNRQAASSLVQYETRSLTVAARKEISELGGFQATGAKSGAGDTVGVYRVFEARYTFGQPIPVVVSNTVSNGYE